MKTSGVLKALAALGHESRLRIFRLLVEKGTVGMPAGEIGEYFSMPGATLSFHLSQLTEAKLLGSRKEGRAVFYFVRFKRIKGVVTYLSEKCCKHEAEQG
jgi:ArsR family transcriptional regulator